MVEQNFARKGKYGSQYQDLSHYLSRDFNPEDLSSGEFHVKQGLKVTILQFLTLNQLKTLIKKVKKRNSINTKNKIRTIQKN